MVKYINYGLVYGGNGILPMTNLSLNGIRPKTIMPQIHGLQTDYTFELTFIVTRGKKLEKKLLRI